MFRMCQTMRRDDHYNGNNFTQHNRIKCIIHHSAAVYLNFGGKILCLKTVKTRICVGLKICFRRFAQTSPMHDYIENGKPFVNAQNKNNSRLSTNFKISRKRNTPQRIDIILPNMASMRPTLFLFKKLYIIVYRLFYKYAIKMIMTH